MNENQKTENKDFNIPDETNINDLLDMVVKCCKRLDEAQVVLPTLAIKIWWLNYKKNHQTDERDPN